MISPHTWLLVVILQSGSGTPVVHTVPGFKTYLSCKAVAEIIIESKVVKSRLSGLVFCATDND